MIPFDSLEREFSFQRTNCAGDSAKLCCELSRLRFFPMVVCEDRSFCRLAEQLQGVLGKPLHARSGIAYVQPDDDRGVTGKPLILYRLLRQYRCAHVTVYLSYEREEVKRDMSHRGMLR